MEKVAEAEIPAVNYCAKSERPTRTTVKVDQSIPAHSIIQTGDVGKQAFALDEVVASKLTPTLKKFTLKGKVAIVTGYVS